MKMEAQALEVVFSRRDSGERSLITVSTTISASELLLSFVKSKKGKLDILLKDTILSIQGFDSITPGLELNLVKEGLLQIVLDVRDCSQIDGETSSSKKPTPSSLSQPSQISLTNGD